MCVYKRASFEILTMTNGQSPNFSSLQEKKNRWKQSQGRGVSAAFLTSEAWNTKRRSAWGPRWGAEDSVDLGGRNREAFGGRANVLCVYISKIISVSSWLCFQWSCLIKKVMRNILAAGVVMTCSPPILISCIFFSLSFLSSLFPQRTVWLTGQTGTVEDT